MLDGDMTDMVEAQSLSLKQQYIDIYSSSWGPDDDGKTVDGPGPLARLALENGIRKLVCVCVSMMCSFSQDQTLQDPKTNTPFDQLWKVLKYFYFAIALKPICNFRPLEFYF